MFCKFFSLIRHNIVNLQLSLKTFVQILELIGNFKVQSLFFGGFFYAFSFFVYFYLFCLFFNELGEKKKKTFHRFEIISCISSIIKNPKMTNLTLRWSYLELWGVERWRWTPSCPCGTAPPRRRFWRSRCRSCTGAHTGSGAGGRTGTSCCWQRTGSICHPVKQQS